MSQILEEIKEELEKYGLTDEQYEALLDDCSKKMNKIIDLDWSEICEKYNIPFNPDTLRKGFQPPLIGGDFIRNYYLAKSNDDMYDKVLREKHRAIQKELIELRTEKLEYNKWLRENTRDDMITNKICQAISTLPPLCVPENIQPTTNADRKYLVAFGDCHYGIEFDLKDLNGNTINSYSPDIFKARMWNLLAQIVDIVEKENIKELDVWELGDGIQGILRLNSQLMKLRYGIIDSSMLYADFLSNWLNELSKHTRVNFQMVIDSNHNQLRICNAPKNAFPEENMSKVMLGFIKERLKDNPNIIISENITGMNYKTFCGYNVLGVHGEYKSLNKAINDMSRCYGCKIDYLIGAHVHHSKTEEISDNCEVLAIRSVIGTDPYGLSLGCTSNAGASLYVFEENNGKICEYSLKLK